MMHRDVEADDPAVAPADDRGLLDFKEIHQPDHIRGHQIVAVRPLVAGAAAVTAAVHDDNAIARLQRAHLMAPVIRVGEPAMQQDDRLAVAEGGVPQLDAVDGRSAALRRLRQSGRRRQGQPLRLGIRRLSNHEAENEAE